MYDLLSRDDFDYSLLDGPPLVVVSDIDETFLRTDFRSVKGLLTAALQFAVDKMIFPDMSLFFRVMRSLPRSALFFISASPRQLLPVLTRKFLLEEIPYDGIVLRDLFRMALRGKLKEIKKPFGYKLCAVLGLARRFPPGTELILLGDDTESDAAVYLTLRRILSGEIDREELVDLLRTDGLTESTVTSVLELLPREINAEISVPGIFIRDTGGHKGLPDPSSGALTFTHPLNIMNELRDQGIVSAEFAHSFERRCESS